MIRVGVQAMGHRGLVAITSATALILGGAAFTTPSAGARPGAGCAHAHTRIAAASRARLQRAAVCLLNQQRRERHLPPLRENSRLNRSAQGWTGSMVRQNDFSHGANFAGRITAAGFHWSAAGENIATGFGTPAAAVRAWMASPDHCRNILTPSFSDVGTGVSARGIRGQGGPGTWTQDFALALGARAPSRNWGPADGCPY